jgi:hypothetical protein
MCGVTYEASPDRILLSPLAASILLNDMEPAVKLFAERCGEDAALIVLGPWISSLEPVFWGTGPGNLKVHLFPHSEVVTTKPKSIAFRVYFHAVDDIIGTPLTSITPLDLPVDLDLMDAVLVLSAIHESAKAMLNDPRMFNVTMIMMSHMNRRVIEYLKSGQALVQEPASGRL